MASHLNKMQQVNPKLYNAFIAALVIIGVGILANWKWLLYLGTLGVGIVVVMYKMQSRNS